MNVLSPREAYRLWAPTYAAETAISFLDEQLAGALSPPLRGLRLLDAGCGVGRRLNRAGASPAVGIDLSFEMLSAGRAETVAAADICALPFAAGQFDLIWCRLVLGHLPDADAAYSEMERVCAPGGHLFVTDFHADAVAVGHQRSFRDSNGVVHIVEHHMHDADAHKKAAELAGFELVEQQDGIIDEPVRSFYERSGRAVAYEKDKGLSVVAAFLFQRSA
jgi:malonyl-CoA O-methyltransferase